MDKATAEYMLNLQGQIDRLWHYLGHSEKAQRARQEANQWQKHTEDLRRELSSYLVQAHVETANYFRVVTAGAYAGYFATWSLVNLQLPSQARFLVALLGIVSLGVFALWEVFMGHQRLRHISQLASILRDTISPDAFYEMRAELNAKEARFISLVTPVWKLVLVVSIGAVISGGAIMIYYFLSALVQ